MEFNDDQYRIDWWERNLEEIDLEIGRMAMICEVDILSPGVIERIFQRDATVCQIDQPAAFHKLHDLLLMHYLNRQKAADELGQALASSIEAYIVARLRKRFPHLDHKG